MDDPADLSRLADIALPPPVPFWPPAPGWCVLAGAAVIAFLILVWACVRHRRRTAYRRAALAELSAIGPASDAERMAAISAILKRAALVAYPRAEVAGLTGQGWLAFLDRTSGRSDFTEGAGRALRNAPFGAPAGDGAAVLAAAVFWVRTHRAEAPPC
ncbi:hypothetical protein GCM10007301_18030 [Azorhizobium oxalatiphilum]|uniref:DUF4381 domain-containing protein n=1 Tax=Azorhizobium oxalatiphilum TaxID=980631 RepID=A0A917F9N8_9HYPH|nr:DUF4381 domain-containing protein [Azorhizobium oxalatiphilum]GGF58720.1 hypothetical protein GCM10007301_18030 [Azorhizobium oxalatiphilum]